MFQNNSNHKKQVILLMISNGKGREAKSEGQWHYLTVEKPSALLRGITFKLDGDFYYLNCLHSFTTEKKFKPIKKYVKIKIFVTLCLLKILKYQNLIIIKNLIKHHLLFKQILSV